MYIKCTTTVAFLSLLLSPAYLAQDQQGSRINQLVRKAHENHQTSAELSPPTVFPTGLSSLDDVFADYALIVGTPVRSVSVVESDSIMTWYIFRKDSVINYPDVDPDDRTWAIPSTIGNIPSDSILVPVDGGTVMVDGVHLTQASRFTFTSNKKYLLVLHIENGGKVGSLAADEASAFLVAPNNRLGNSHQNHPLVQEIENVYSADLGRLSSDPRKRVRLQ
jgi:hypothetical protein